MRRKSIVLCLVLTGLLLMMCACSSSAGPKDAAESFLNDIKELDTPHG